MRSAKETQGNLPAGEKPRAVGPSYRPELETSAPQQADLLAPIADETAFINALHRLNVDVYAEPECTDLAERVGRAIVRREVELAIAGRHPVTRRPEECRDAFERLFGRKLPKPKTRESR